MLTSSYNIFNDIENTFNSFIDSVPMKKIQRLTDNLPWNVIIEEDGSNAIEVAVPGKTRDDIKVKGITEDGTTYLTIEVIEKEISDEEKEKQEKRQYFVHKMKSGAIFTKLSVPSNLDIKKTTVAVENGLLTIKIPVAEEAKPMEFEIQ